MNVDFGDLETAAVRCRRIIVDIAGTEVGCHLGGSLSAVEIVLAGLEFTNLNPDSRLVYSKGHASAALYAALHVGGVLPDDPAQGYGRPGSYLTGHPNHHVDGVIFPTGSLGHGIAYALGWALATRVGQRTAASLAVLGDGELQEGLVWETCQVASARQAGNLVVLVDVNGGQNDGLVEDISPTRDMIGRFRSFGFETAQVDGHDVVAIGTALRRHEVDGGQPLAVLCRTVKARGIAELEGAASSHYVTASREQVQRWKQEL